MAVFENITQTVGKTPLVKINSIKNANVYAKLEMFNPMSSIKDRIAVFMIDKAESEGLIKPGGLIIEPTSGNTGIGLAWVAAARGYKIIITMPDTMSKERQNILKALGATVILTDGKKGMTGAINKANQLLLENLGAFMPKQFENLTNPLTHYETTATEIYSDMNGEIDIFISAVGTGGTISGIGKFLKEKNSAIKIIAVEPASSAVLSGKDPSIHKIQGIGPGFIPKTLNTKLLDEIITVTDDEAKHMLLEIAKNEGLLIGISSGAALFAATNIASRPENTNKQIVVIFPDSGERYLSDWPFNFT